MGSWARTASTSWFVTPVKSCAAPTSSPPRPPSSSLVVLARCSSTTSLCSSPSSATSLPQHSRAIQKLVVSLPGQETGLKMANGVHYGNVVKFMNLVKEYMVCDHNGWLTMSNPGVGTWDHFVLVSPLHREGIVTFGDDVALRAHNGRMVSIRTEGELEAVSESLTDTSSFKLIGTAGASSGVVHSRDFVILHSQTGYIDAKAKQPRVALDPSGH